VTVVDDWFEDVPRKDEKPRAIKAAYLVKFFEAVKHRLALLGFEPFLEDLPLSVIDSVVLGDHVGVE
jgi:hypothetical protein